MLTMKLNQLVRLSNAEKLKALGGKDEVIANKAEKVKQAIIKPLLTTSIKAIWQKPLAH